MIRYEPLYLIVALILLASPPIYANEAGTIEVSGKVILPDGSPAAGATVAVGWAETYITTTTDDSGIYKLSLKQGQYFITAVHGNLAITDPYAMLNVKEDGKVDGNLELKLGPGVEVSGKLVDKTTGEPVGEASIELNYDLHTTTAPDGTFKFSALPKDSYSVIAKKDGYCWTTLDFITGDKEKITLPLETAPGGVVKGRVTDEEGKPIAEARVGTGGSFGCMRVRTDADGYYSRGGFDLNGRTEISAGKDGYVSSPATLVVFPAGKNEATIDFELKSAKEDVRTITGRVVDGDGKPVAGVNVSYGWSNCYAYRKVVQTDSDGRYKLENVDTTKNLIVAQAGGYAPAFKAVESNKDLQVDLTLEPEHRVSGTVVDKDGKPLDGVHISTLVNTPEMEIMGFCSGNIFRYIDSGAVTDKEGRFSLAALPAAGVLVDVYTMGYSDIRDMPLEVDRDDHVVTMLPTGQISGTVLQANNGEPVKQFKVYLDFPTQRLPGDKSSGINCSMMENGLAFTNDDGKFEVPELGHGSVYAVVIEAPGFQRARVDRVKVRLASEEGEEWPVFKLKPSAPFEGVITDSAGKPVEGVIVTILDTDEPGLRGLQWAHLPDSCHPVSTKTDTEGRFSMDLAASAGVVLLEKPGFGRKAIENVEFAEPLKAIIDKAATISGVVLDDQGKPVKEQRLAIESANGDITYDYVYTDSRGEFSATDLPAGDFIVIKNDENRWTRIQQVSVEAGENHRVDWDRMGEVVLQGKVTTKAKPDGEVYVGVYPGDGGMFVALDKVDKNGSYKLSLPKPGDYLLSFNKNDPTTNIGGIYIRKPVSVKAGINTFDQQMPGCSISGRVVDASGKPVANIKVEALRKRAISDIYSGAKMRWYAQHVNPRWIQEKTATTDSEGRFALCLMQEGAWVIAVRPNDNARGCITGEPLHLRADESVSGVEVKMPETGDVELTLVDAKTGEVLSDAYSLGRNSQNVLFGPDTEGTGGGCASGMCGLPPASTQEGARRFSNLAPGRYRFFQSGHAYLPASVVVEVKPGETSKATLKLDRSQQVVFKLTGVPDEAKTGNYWIGYKLRKPGVKEPVLEDAYGPYWGDLIYFPIQAPYEAKLPLEPGDYEIEMVLRQEKSQHTLLATENLWEDTRKIKVTEGKDFVIEIPVTEK